MKLFLPFLVITAFMSAAAGVDQIQLTSAKLLKDSFQQGEAVSVLISLTSKAKDPARLPVNTSSMDAFEVNCVPAYPSNRATLAGTASGGIAAGEQSIEIKPLTTTGLPLLLNERFSFQNLGQYSVKIALKNTAAPPIQFKFDVVNARPGSLISDYAQIFAEYKKVGTTPERRAFIERELSLTTHPDAVPVQLRMVTENRAIPPEIQMRLYRAIVLSMNSEAIQKLLSLMTGGDRSQSDLASFFYALKTVDIDGLNDGTKQLLAAYRDKIRNAAPVSISD
jgi:hypothetical protein